MIAAVVLAAGASTRFGSPKQQLLLAPVLERVRAARAVDDVVVVVGAHPVETDARTVRCAEWERGPGASLRCGLRALAPGTEAAVVVLADGPRLAPAALDRVVDSWRARGGDVVAAGYGGERGHPVLLARPAWDRVPDAGARALEPRLVPCDDLGAPGDVDRLSDLVQIGQGAAEWAPEAVVDEAAARRLIASQFPDLELRSLRSLGAGWDNTVWLVDERWVFRFPRRAVAVPAVERQLAVLPLLEALLPLPIPVPRFAGRPADGYPWPFAGHLYLRGREVADVQPDAAARAAGAEPLAAFLRALHRPELLDRVTGARDLPVDPFGRADMGRRVPLTRTRFSTLAEAGIWTPDPRALRILDEAAGLGPPPGRTVVHGDLHIRHLLVGADGRPAAVIDWDDLGLADPAVDLSLVWSFLPPSGRPRFLEAYGPVSEERLVRARVLALFLCSTLAAYAHREGHSALEREALESLERTITD